MITINVIGLGYVGLTTALAFADKGSDVIGVDQSLILLKKLAKGNISIHEPFLKEKLKKCIKNEKIIFQNHITLSKNKINIIFICVGTPQNKDGSVDLNQIKDVVIQVCKKISNEKVIIVIKSTVPPGSTEKIKKISKMKKNINYISNPEFLREGSAWKDVINADKILIGGDNKNSIKYLKMLYKKFNGKIIVSNFKTAEFTKYLSNSILANLVSFSNYMAMLSENIQDIDTKKSFDAVSLDKRWFGSPAKIIDYFKPGLGYGGYCLPKDVEAINFISKKIKMKTNMLDEINTINNFVIHHHFGKIKNLPKKTKIYILGLSFKPNSNDLRYSKSIELVNMLINHKFVNLILCDPICIKEVKKIFKEKAKYRINPVIEKGAKYILTTAWKEYIVFLNKVDAKDKYNLRYE